MKRSGKFYRKNEAEVMRLLGFRPTINSGSGWIEKEDGINEGALCQLKSTDAKSIKVVQQDLHTLEYNSQVAHKLPVFAIQFLNSNEVFLIIKPEHLQDVSKFIDTGKYDGESLNEFIGVDLENHEEIKAKKSKVIKSSLSAREKFNNEMQNKFKKKHKSAT